MAADKTIEKRWEEDGLIGVVDGKVVEATDEYMDWEPEGDETRDAAPRTLYVRRDVVNSAEIAAHYERQGVEVQSGLHVTVAHSNLPVDWIAVGEDWGGESDGTFVVAPGGARLHERLGPDGATVALLFTSSRLTYRHVDIKERGASWDWPDYQPHVSVAQDPDKRVNVQALEPWRGAIKLGPEIFEEVKNDAR